MPPPRKRTRLTAPVIQQNVIDEMVEQIQSENISITIDKEQIAQFV